MNVSIHKPRPTETRSTSMVLPKVNVRPPSDDQDALSLHLAAPTQEDTVRNLASPATIASTNASARHVPVWDVKFSLGLILLVIMVNLGLTLLLGTPTKPQEEQSAVFKQPVAGEQGAAPQASNGAREAKVFISGEDKRVLLRQLNTMPAATSEKRPEEPGTYRAMGGDAPALSLTGANRPSVEQE